MLAEMLRWFGGALSAVPSMLGLSLDSVTRLMIFICDLPVWAGAGLVIGTGVAISLTGMLLLRSYFLEADLVENNILGGFKYVYLAQIFASFLFFPTVEGGLKYSNSITLVGQETEALRLVDKLASQIEGPAAAELRKQVAAYARSAVDNEARTLIESGDQHPDTVAQMQGLLRAMLQIDVPETRDPYIQERLSQQVFKVLTIRQQRMALASDDLLPLAILTLLVVALTSLMLMWFFGNPNVVALFSMATILSACIMAAVYATFILNNPYIGPLSVGVDRLLSVTGGG